MNTNPVKTSYAALWEEYGELKSTIPVMNVIRKILEYYFLQMCGYEGFKLREVILEQNKDKFVDEAGNEDHEKYQLASAMLSYINADNLGADDGLNYIDDYVDISECRDVFKMIFKLMGQEQHYKKMSEIFEQGE